MQMYVLNGTNMAMPMQGTNMAVPMQGTNMAVPMQGTNAVVPLQGLNGDFYDVEIDPLALIDDEDVPLQGIPDDYDDEDIDRYRLAYMVGDPDAMQGLFKNLKSKIQQARAGNKAARNERREERNERQESRQAARAVRRDKAARGEGFFDKVGGFVKNIGEAKRIAAEAGAALDDAGIDYDTDVLEQRAALAADAGAQSGDVRMTRSSEGGGGTGGGLQAWWGARSDLQKGGIVVGSAFGLYALYRMANGQPIFGKKKGGKR